MVGPGHDDAVGTRSGIHQHQVAGAGGTVCGLGEVDIGVPVAGMSRLLLCEALGERDQSGAAGVVAEDALLDKRVGPSLGVSTVKSEVVGGIELNDLSVVFGAEPP